MSTEDNNYINYLDQTITRNTERLETDIFRKPTATSTTIHARSNHLQEQKNSTLHI